MIVTAILYLLFTVIHIIFGFIDTYILTFIPILSDLLNSISQYMTTIFTYMDWLVSLVGLPALAFTIIATYYTFVLTVPFFIWISKLGIHWFK